MDKQSFAALAKKIQLATDTPANWGVICLLQEIEDKEGE